MRAWIAALLLCLERAKLVVEPAGASPVATGARRAISSSTSMPKRKFLVGIGETSP